jgi:WD40 repeat protein
MGYADYIRSVAYSPDGRRVVSGSDDRTLQTWDVETGVKGGEFLVRNVSITDHLTFARWSRKSTRPFVQRFLGCRKLRLSSAPVSDRLIRCYSPGHAAI